MIVRKAQAVWDGNLQQGTGRLTTGSGAFDLRYGFGTRFGDEPGTNPEELIGAAHAGCFSMALSGALGRAGATPTRIQTRAEVSMDKTDAGFRIQKVKLFTEVQASGIDEAKFQEVAEGAKKGCPISNVLAAVPIELEAKLLA